METSKTVGIEFVETHVIFARFLYIIPKVLIAKITFGNFFFAHQRGIMYITIRWLYVRIAA